MEQGRMVAANVEGVLVKADGRAKNLGRVHAFLIDRCLPGMRGSNPRGW
jgi:hypothetical protein